MNLQVFFPFHHSPSCHLPAFLTANVHSLESLERYLRSVCTGDHPDESFHPAVLPGRLFSRVARFDRLGSALLSLPKQTTPSSRSWSTVRTGGVELGDSHTIYAPLERGFYHVGFGDLDVQLEEIYIYLLICFLPRAKAK